LIKQLKADKIKLTDIFNTHHHRDHAGGNLKLRADLKQYLPQGTTLEIFGGKDCEGVTKTPKDREDFSIGDIKVKGFYTPCHTQDSICWFMEDSTGRVVFTGDTLFHGGMDHYHEQTT
jgi:hydroxyacylglutathione hydrolase